MSSPAARYLPYRVKLTSTSATLTAVLYSFTTLRLSGRERGGHVCMIEVGRARGVGQPACRIAPDVVSRADSQAIGLARPEPQAHGPPLADQSPAVRG